MSSLADLTIAQYNNYAYVADHEQAGYLLSKLQEDVKELFTHLENMQARYQEVNQGLCDEVGQLGEDILDRLRAVDPAQRLEYDTWAEESSA